MPSRSDRIPRLRKAELAASADVLDRLAEAVGKGEITGPARTVAALQGAAVALRATAGVPDAALVEERES